MPKKYAATTTTLIIVESPAKCKKIEEILGPGYKCVASYGHIRELNSLKNIDIENNFNPSYTLIDNAIKKNNIELLKREIKKATDVILATDNDREGEAIAWHICDVFKLNINTTKRIIFQEITETAIRYAINNPMTINMSLVQAQQTRQILDILVGFKISPILWKIIAKNKDNALSAGRCQTPALKLIYDNYLDIKNNEEKKIYKTIGYFTNLNLSFELNKQFETEDDMINFLNGTMNFSHIYNCSRPIKSKKSPPEPLTTSRLQQIVSNELHYSPKETMRICQILYENGFITYMRTDSKTYSGEFIDVIRTYIETNYGAKFVRENLEIMSERPIKNTTTNMKKQKTQEAHEAIRPTNIFLSELPETIDSKERRLYKLIWTITMESCMSESIYNSITASISGYENTLYTYKCEVVDFPGWKIVENKFSLDSQQYSYLQLIKQNEILNYKKIISKVAIQGTKQHYTEARLVQLLEERGIGRPSTFSSLVDKIQQRGYVKKEDVKGKELFCKDYELENREIFEIESKREFGNEKNKLVIQPLGIIVMEFLNEHFLQLFNYDYTSSMEESLDKICKDEIIWSDLCFSYNGEITKLIDNLTEKGIISKMEFKIDEDNTYLVGKYGPVIKSVQEIDGKEKITFKTVKKDIDIRELEKGNYVVDDIIETNKSTKSSYILGQHENKNVILKKGKFGLYITWGENTKNLKELGNRPIENITFDEIKKYLDEGSNVIREINKNTYIRKGPKGDYIFYKSPHMKKPKFFDIKNFINETQEDYKICNLSILKSWIFEKYNI